MPIVADNADLAACITACAQARDDRGRWRAVDRCAVGLAERRHNALLCRAAAAAAGRIGAWLAAQPNPVSSAALVPAYPAARHSRGRSGFAPGPANAAARGSSLHN